MAEISNKTLAGLLVGLIVISLVSLFFTMTKLAGPGVTGYASSIGTGITNITVVEATYINVTDNFIDLGTVETGYGNNSENRNDFFTIQNDGSVNINLSVYDSSGGPFSGTGCASLPNACYQVHGNSSQSGSIDGVYTQVPAAAPSQHPVCTNIVFADGTDECVIGVMMTVPVDEPAGEKTSTMTLVAGKA